MKIYRRVIPSIAKDIIHTLIGQQAIEVAGNRRDEAELDIAAVFVRHLNAMDELAEDTQNWIDKKGLGKDHFFRIREEMAQSRSIPIGEQELPHVLQKAIEALFDSEAVIEVFLGDEEIRGTAYEVVLKYIGVDRELDREVRGRLRNLREGSPEWSQEYGRLIDKVRIAR